MGGHAIVLLRSRYVAIGDIGNVLNHLMKIFDVKHYSGGKWKLKIGMEL